MASDAAVNDDEGAELAQLRALVTALESSNTTLQTTNAELIAKNRELEQIVAHLQRLIFGRKSEVTVRPTTSVFCPRRRDAARHGKTERATRGDRTMAAIA